MLKDSGLNSHLWLKAIKLQFISRTSLLLEYSTWHSMKHEQAMFLTSQVFASLISLLEHTFLRNNISKVKFEDCSLKCHYLDMKESSIFCVWDSESEQVLESHNCFVDESITAYENIANIEVHSKKKTTSTSNHAVDLLLHSHSCCHNLLCFRECLHQLHCCFDSCYYSNQILHLFCFRKHLPLHIVSLNSWVQTHKF
jgi:hypothetical protein